MLLTLSNGIAEATPIAAEPLSRCLRLIFICSEDLFRLSQCARPVGAPVRRLAAFVPRPAAPGLRFPYAEERQPVRPIPLEMDLDSRHLVRFRSGQRR